VYRASGEGVERIVGRATGADGGKLQQKEQGRDSGDGTPVENPVGGQHIENVEPLAQG